MAMLEAPPDARLSSLITRSIACGLLCISACISACISGAWPDRALAQDKGALAQDKGALVPDSAVREPAESATDHPAHALATLSVGAPLRLTRNVDLDQDRFAPVFVDMLFGYTLLNGSIQHGLGLGASLNLSEEGGFTEPVGIANQLVLMPAYLGYHAIDNDWALLGHLGIPIALTGTAELEVALGGGYRWLAGVLAYAELGANAFLGTSSTLHATVSLELGFMLDYEVLP
jgi:hypothetical protein